MTAAEFDEWWEDFLGRWPDMGEWFMESRSESTQRAILQNWATALEDVTLAEALAVNRAMYSGDLDSFTGRWDRDRIPAIVRKHAIAQRPPVTEWTGPDDSPPPPNPRMQEAFCRMIEKRKAGASAEECDAYLAKLFPPEPRERQRRYKCVECLDLGRREIWHPDRVYIADRDGIEAALRSHYTTSAVACRCEAGNMYASRKIPLPRFDLLKHCPAFNSDVSSPAAVADFEAWKKHDRGNVRNRTNFEPAFANYARQQEALLG